MAACRKTDRADLMRIDAVFFSMSAHKLDGALHVFELARIVVAAFRHAVAQNKRRDTETVEPCCGTVPFIVHAKVVITSAGADDHCRAVLLSGSAHEHDGLCSAGNVSYAFPEFYDFFFGKSGKKKSSRKHHSCE
jgi:hypothetical protein